MVHKKKFHGGYGLFFGVLFSLLFVFSSSTCLGLETGRMTYDQAKYLFDYFLTNKYFTHDVFSFSWDSDSTPEIYGRNTIYRNQMYDLYYNTANIENFVTAFNDIDSQYNNLGVEHYLFYCFGNTEYFWIRFLPINNTIGNDVPHLRIGIYNNYSATGYGVATNVLIRTTETSNYEQLNVRFDTSGNFYPYARGSYDVKYLSYKGADNLFARVPGYSDTVCYAIQNMTSINNSYFYSTSALNVVQPDYNTYNTVYILKSFYEPPTPTPTPTPIPTPGDGSSGTITDNNGQVTGSIDLSGIENGIKDVQNQISGDTQKIVNSISGESQKLINTITDQPDLSQTEITEEQITDAIGFDFMADPYENFWLQMTTGLSGSLTGSVRQLPINILGYQGVFDLDNLNFNYPASIRLILTSITTVCMVWILVKWWKIIIDKLTSGDMDEVLAMNEEERYR